MKYSGCIIEESLKDKSIINEFNILEEINDDGIMWIVEVDESKLGYVLPTSSEPPGIPKVFVSERKFNSICLSLITATVAPAEIKGL